MGFGLSRRLGEAAEENLTRSREDVRAEELANKSSPEAMREYLETFFSKGNRKQGILKVLKKKFKGDREEDLEKMASDAERGLYPED